MREKLCSIVYKTCCGSVMLKINTVFNGEFVAGNKSAIKSIATRKYKLFRSTDLQEWLNYAL